MVSEGEDIERDEQSVEQLVRQHRVEAGHAQTHNVVDVVEMVQVFSHQPLQPATVQVATHTHTHRQTDRG